MAGTANVKPLDGVNVLDFCWVAVGPMTTKYLAEYGATVVRVESAKRPGTLRRAAPFKDGVSGINRSGYFASYNANKMGITVDMRHPRARELMLRMTSWAHIVTENFTPGTMEDWGLGFDELREVNPAVVMFSTSMMGRGGPMERQPGFGPVLSSLVGLTNLTGWPDRAPVNPYGAYTDFIVPRFAVAAILAALDHSRRTGEGTHLGPVATGNVAAFLRAAACSITPSTAGSRGGWATATRVPRPTACTRAEAKTGGSPSPAGTTNSGTG